MFDQREILEDIIEVRYLWNPDEYLLQQVEFRVHERRAKDRARRALTYDKAVSRESHRRWRLSEQNRESKRRYMVAYNARPEVVARRRTRYPKEKSGG